MTQHIARRFAVEPDFSFGPAKARRGLGVGKPAQPVPPTAEKVAHKASKAYVPGLPALARYSKPLTTFPNPSVLQFCALLFYLARYTRGYRC